MNRRLIPAAAGALAAVLLLAIGIAIGSGRDQADDPEAIQATSATAPEAAANVVTAMLDGDTLTAPNPRAVMAELLTPKLLAQWEALATKATTDVIDPLGGTLAVSGRVAAVRTWALSTHLEDHDDTTATVSVWTLSIAEGSMQPDSPRTIGWRTATVELVWDVDHWVADHVDFAGGPVPGGEPQLPSSPASVVRAALGEPWK